MGEIELGIVCGKCDRHSRMGTGACPECGNDLALFQPEKAQRKRPPPAVAAAAAVARVDRTAHDADPPTLAQPAAMVAPSQRVLDADDAPPSSMFEQRLKPRRSKSDDGLAAATGSAVASSRAFSDKQSAPEFRAAPPSPARAERNAAPKDSSATSSPATGTDFSSLSLEELMEQAKHFVCRSCSTPVPMGHKFCGRCGAGVPPEIVNARTQFFGQLQVPGKAKLILIRGEGVEGLSYQLNAEQHTVGRTGQLVFPDDQFVSPKHANLFYRNGKLVVRDEGSVNGVYIRVRGSVDIAGGDYFLSGEQLFRFELAPPPNEGPGPDGTYFYASPKHQSTFRVTQMLQGGAPGMTVCARGTTLQIGREGGDLNFPVDLYMSATHCRIEEQAGKHTLTDLNSRNGTYIRLQQERELSHGDYLFIGRKLLRVEITAA